jgi:hypothetical protein
MAKEMGAKERAARELREAAFERPAPKRRMILDDLKKIAKTPAKSTAERKAEKRRKAEDKADGKIVERALADIASGKEKLIPAAEAEKIIFGKSKKKTKAKKPTKVKAASSKKIVTSKDVADFMARPPSKDNPKGGATMEELCERFGIAEHPMRAKIAHARHKMGLNVELESRYYNRGPVKEA